MGKAFRSIAAAATIAISLAGCIGGPSVEVLFIGNSYTFGNDLPGVFADLADSGGHRVSAEMVAVGGWWLADHANSVETTDKIASQEWDYVVLQEQSIVPSVPSERNSRMIPAAQDLAGRARSAGATPVLFMTWARRYGFPDVGYDSYGPMQAAIRDAYVSLGNNLVIPIAPVGIAWSDILANHGEIPLYLSDASHPTPHGTYLTACVFYATIFGESPVGLPHDAGLGEETSAVLQEAASRIVLNEPEQWNVTVDQP